MDENLIASRPMVLDEFLPLVGKRFIADCNPSDVEITLTDALPLKDHGITDRPPFILIFHTPPEYMLAEGSYAMRCGKWGPDRIYIGSMVAPAMAEPGYYYQAIFN